MTIGTSLLLVDAEGQTLGRWATRLADTLRGKGKRGYTRHVDTGVFVVVVKAEKIAAASRTSGRRRTADRRRPIPATLS